MSKLFVRPLLAILWIGAVNIVANAWTTEQQVVREIYFQLDRATIQPAARTVLHEVAELLRAHPETKVHVAGYTCDLAPDDYNLRLARRRADAAKRYLMRVEGIARDRITETSFGEAQPAYPNTDEAGRAKNRRVVLTLGLPSAIIVPPAAASAVAPTPAATAAPAAAAAASPAPITRAVNISVLDAAGNFIPNLPASRFTVREAGVVREITDVSFTMEQPRAAVGLLLDVSPSNCLVDLRDALQDFLARANPATRWYAVSFSEDRKLISDFTATRDELLNALPKRAASGGTRLYDAVAASATAMTARPAPRYMLVFSDGVDEAPWPNAGTTGSVKTLDQAVTTATTAGVKLVCVELGPTAASGSEALHQLAQRTSGMKMVWDRDAGANQFADVHRLLAAGALSGRYTITYHTEANVPAGATVTTDAGTVR
ncbi:MAG TPA: OmpA family protein [bacterium]|nr:OmpA family protein [bacterium]